MIYSVRNFQTVSVNLQEHMQNYRGKAFGALPPHVFALAESAYSALQVSNESFDMNSNERVHAVIYVNYYQ